MQVHTVKFLCTALQSRQTSKPWTIHSHFYSLFYCLLLFCNRQSAATTAYPFPAEFCWKVTPALAAGNTVVIKVSKETTLTALMMGDLILQAGLPAGVVNILTGPGSSLGDAMVEHPLVDKVRTSLVFCLRMHACQA